MRKILFDLDGTLHDKSASLHCCGQAFFDEFLAHGNIACADFINMFVRENCVIQPKAIVFEKIGKAFALSTDVKEAMRQRFDDTFHEYAQRFDFVEEMLAMLQETGVTIGCVTNGRDFFQRNKLKALALEPYFDVVVTSGAVGIKKPDAKIFHYALTALEAAAADTVFVGDSLTADMQPAKALGMTTIWKTEGAAAQPAYVDYRLQTFADFPAIWAQIVSAL